MGEKLSVNHIYDNVFRIYKETVSCTMMENANTNPNTLIQKVDSHLYRDCSKSHAWSVRI